MTRIQELAAYLEPRLTASAIASGPHSEARADLDLMDCLLHSLPGPFPGSAPAQEFRYRLLFDIAAKHGWTSEVDFLPEWKLGTSHHAHPSMHLPIRRSADDGSHSFLHRHG